MDAVVEQGLGKSAYYGKWVGESKLPKIDVSVPRQLTGDVKKDDKIGRDWCRTYLQESVMTIQRGQEPRFINADKDIADLIKRRDEIRRRRNANIVRE